MSYDRPFARAKGSPTRLSSTKIPCQTCSCPLSILFFGTIVSGHPVIVVWLSNFTIPRTLRLLKRMPEISQVKIHEPRSLLSGGAGWKTLGDNISRRLWLLESDSLCAEARRRTRLDDFGDPPIDPVLTVLVNSLETEADLHPHGRFLMRVHLRELLETRLRLAHAWSRLLEVLESSLIQRPLFITGMPRSGSTFLHELLAEDPENRAPRVWEVMFPLRIESEPSDKVDSRVQKTEACLCWFRRLAPGADSVYPMRARTPHECVAIHSYTLTLRSADGPCAKLSRPGAIRPRSPRSWR